MEQIELRNILSSNFDFGKWKSILDLMFSKTEHFTKEVAIDAMLIKSGGQMGNIRLDDGRSLAIFKFEVADNIVISRNRKGLRDIAAHYVDQSLIHGAWVFYYSQNQSDYRLTYIAKQTYFTPEGELLKSETAPKRYTFLLGENEKCTTAASRLYELIAKKEKGAVSLIDVTEAFSVERLNKEFFAGYKVQYNKFLELRNKESKDDRDYVKKLLGRLVFLQFLQKKGWMGVPATTKDWNGGDKDYLLNLVNKYDGNNCLLSDVLEPLFFNTLNEKRPGHIAVSILGDNIKIPYLNGGLFDKDRLDRLNIDFPYAYFKELMLFFSMYNFTIDENDPDDAEIGVDPEMLGHIFESLLEDNKDKGAFYTPKEIVHYMSRESITQYLKTYTDKKLHSSLEQLVKSGKVSEELQDKDTANEICDLLKKVKVCDPAIGSGAFPMGVLNVLFHSRQLLYGFAKPKSDFSHAQVKREIIQDNIYGVDIEQGAVDIARLRFWLALVVDELEPQPLPNLEYKIMCGDSLLNRFALDAPFDDVLKNYNREHKTNYTLADYKEWVKKYTNESDHAKKYIFKQKIDDIKNAFKTELGKKDKKVIDKKRKKINDLEVPIMLLERTKLEKEQLKKYKKELEQLLLKKQNIEANKLYENAFEWRFEFPWLLNENGNFIGFDIVIGNPPYLRIQGIRSINPVFAEELVKRYKSATGSFDLYAVFVEKGLQIINQGGIVNYIMPVKWTNSAFGKGLRKIVTEQQSACIIINFGAYQVFNASTYTGLHWFKPHSNELLYYELDRNLATNHELGEYLCLLNQNNAANVSSGKLGSDMWVLTITQTANILNELKQQPRRVSDIFENIFCGLQTSMDNIYFLYDCVETNGVVMGTSKYLDRKVTVERGLVKPLLKGENVHRYDNILTDRFVILPYKLETGKATLYTESEISIFYPQGYTYLKECENALRGREKGRFDIDGEWFQFGRKQGILFAEKEKLVARDISMGGDFSYDEKGEFYQTTTVYGYIKKTTVKESYKFWMALLNSRLCWWFLKNTGTTLANGFFRFKPNYINPFPVPHNISIDTEKAVVMIVDYILLIKSLPKDQLINEYVNNDVVIRQFENLIDALIYELYFAKEFKDTNISFANYVNRDFIAINIENKNQATKIVEKSYQLLRNINCEIRSNLKYMAVKMEYILAPILNM